MKIFPLKQTRLHLHFVREDFHLVGKKWPSLSNSEMKELESTWPGLKFYQIDLLWNCIYKKFHGFSPYYLGAMQGHIIRCALNPQKQLVSLENKAMCDVWFPEIPFPKVYVRCLEGILYDSNMNQITIEEAANLLLNKEEFVVKPSVDTLCGAGVKRIRVSESNHDTIKKNIFDAGKNFIAQEVLLQEETIANLNPTSINCCRLTTLYINGKFDYSSMIKIGKKGSHVDNWHSSYLIGMSKDGKLFNYGYDKQLNVIEETDNGIKFGGIEVPGYNKMVELVEKEHKKYFPFCGIIGWDIIIDKNGNPRVIEANLTVPGLVGEQLVSGTFFEPFVDDIVMKLKK